MSISVAGLNVLQTGAGVAPYVVGPRGPRQVIGYGGTSALDRAYTSSTDSLLSATYADLLQRTHAHRRRDAIEAADVFAAAVDGVTVATPFPATALGRQLRMVAQSIAARDRLSQRRQVFFVGLGGWDHHDAVLEGTAAMFPDVAASLAAFDAAMRDLGTHDAVTLFTASDFGRTLTSNGDGTDHAWGGNTIVMGGGIAGGRVFGEYPETLAASPLDTGRGRLIPTTSVDELAADLALWFGIPNDDTLETVLPNVRNFYSSSASGSPLGLFGA